jgi:hypothetical protein
MTVSRNDLPRFRLRSLFVLTALVAIVCVGIFYVSEALEAPWDSYATWDGANLVITHLHSHNNEWPSGWGDLEAAMRSGAVLMRGGNSFDRFQDRLEIDFNVNPKEFAAASPTAPQGLPKVIRLRNGKDTHWEGAEPNEMIHQYLNDPDAFFTSGNY